MFSGWRAKMRRLKEEKQRTGMSLLERADADYSQWKADRIQGLLDLQQKTIEKREHQKQEKELAQQQVEKIKRLEELRRTQKK